MCESRFDEKVLQPTMCPFCQSDQVDPDVGQTVTATAAWRCRDCRRTWTLADARAGSKRVH